MSDPSPAIDRKTMTQSGDEITEAWEVARERLMKEFPDKKEGILFCIWKLRQDPRLTLTDFRDEANLRGVPLGGRSLHSAKVALGMEEPSKRRRSDRATHGGARVHAAARTTTADSTRTPRSGSSSDPDALEQQLLANIAMIKTAASGESQRLKEAVREAIRILQNALGD
ncbi:MAG: hypothetical protein H6832_05905 [Planctomycetes bacterium]|nr:hypothetical protein [Planctomycetota bacterium]MCB9917919.1 hypothetical protein [Planctomycetota bacterium]